ncbi:proline--tRNA ligase [Rhodopirellula sp.]|nr:proline--tRNA ligase [Rubripirellula sp.]MDA7874704.1 proline--tRNA ligase [Rhodopirellula sp.]MDA7914732.1 proline--tRNA ligase [bacterium]MDA7905074.1 proline--tRNA ligase [Rhodopirellula sp.]MDB4557858.1 proline--tRNA ligase [bacterium]MDB4621465.1 proline--tRNA ligase [Rubripirellula sp.]
MAKAPKNAISPSRAEDYPEWYQQVIRASDLAENSPVRGCMVIKPWGYRLWENMQRALDDMFKATGHQNAYFPLFIPMSFLEKEAEHVEGFAKECAVVTHHRLEPDPDGGLRPAGKLEEPLIVRPTSETIIGATYAKWVQSYRDLPILINQWANVVRWEMRTRMFLRTAEFLWQEGHTVHATSEEAIAETEQMIDVYADFAENWMAMPVIIGSKTADERFPGAVETLSIEAMMQDRKALQAGTSHFLGQNFSKAQEIAFQAENGEREYAWTTSWGVSTRLVGALIMSHSDDDGLVIPPRLAPAQVVILPIYRDDSQRAEVLEYVGKVKEELSAQQYEGSPIRVEIDDRDIRGGEKKWHHVKRGVPVRLEIGPKDIQKDAVFLGRRDQPKSAPMSRGELIAGIAPLLAEMQQGLFDAAAKLRDDNSCVITNESDFRDFFTPENEQDIHGGFAHCHFSSEEELQPLLKELKVTIRCIPRDGNDEPGTCFLTGKPAEKKAIFAKAY